MLAILAGADDNAFRARYFLQFLDYRASFSDAQRRISFGRAGPVCHFGILYEFARLSRRTSKMGRAFLISRNDMGHEMLPA